jgi:hypothetical protein
MKDVHKGFNRHIYICDIGYEKMSVLC